MNKREYDIIYRAIYSIHNNAEKLILLRSLNEIYWESLE